MGVSKNTFLHFPTSKLDWPWILRKSRKTRAAATVAVYRIVFFVFLAPLHAACCPPVVMLAKTMT